MIFFFDTSALIKNYIEEAGSNMVSSILNEADEIYISEICLIECISTVRRIYKENDISKEEYFRIKKEIKTDMQYFQKIHISDIVEIAEELVDKYQLKSLDSIQLGSMLFLKTQIDKFVCCDSKLLSAAQKESIATINPVKATV